MAAAVGRGRAGARRDVGRPRGRAPPAAGRAEPPDLPGRRAADAPYVLRVLDPAVSAAASASRRTRRSPTRCGRPSPASARGCYEVLPGRAGARAGVPARADPRRGRRARRRRPIPASRRPAGGCTPGPRFGNDFDIFAKRDELLDLCRRHDLPLPDGYLDRLPTVDARSSGAGRRAAADACRATTTCCRRTSSTAGDVRPDRRLPALRQQRPGLRARRHRRRGRLRPRPGRPAGRGVLRRRADRRAARPGAAEPDRCPTSPGRCGSPSTTGCCRQAADADFDYDAEAADKWGQAVRDLDAPELRPAARRASAGRAPRTYPSPHHHARRLP